MVKMGIKDIFAFKPVKFTLKPVKKDERLEGIERILGADEEIITTVGGTGQGKLAGIRLAKGILVLTPKRVLFYYTFGKKNENYGVEDYSLDEISSINFNMHEFAGSVKIHSNNNVINVINIPPSEDIEGFVKATNQQIEIYKRENTQISNNNLDVADQISKLAALRDKGILTEEEFTMQKRKLLGL